MKVKIILTILACILCLLVIACGSSGVVGKWQDANRVTIEFTKDNQLILNTGTSIVTGTYELIGSDVIKVKLNGLAGASLSLFGNDTLQYKISGSNMVITISGKGDTFVRQ